MRKGWMLAAAILTVGTMPAGARAAEAATCADTYLVCLNDASQQEGWLYRTAREFECGVEYYACMRRKATG